MTHRRSVAAASAIAIAVLACSTSALAQTVSQPTYTLIESGKKVYGRASQDFRNIGLIDYWWVGHDNAEGPFKALRGVSGRYSAVQAFSLPNRAVDGTNMDRHECGFLHLNGDAKVDMVCTVGADRGAGEGPNEVYRNDSTEQAVRMTRIEGALLPTGIEDPSGRHRALEPFRFADGSQGLWSVVVGIPRDDGQPNVNRLYRYNGSGTFKFTEVTSPAINITTLYTCSRAGDLNADGLDDLLLCRTAVETSEPADSILYLQQPDGSFSQAELPMAGKRFRTAEIVDMNGDGRNDLLVSVNDGVEARIEIYLQDARKQLQREPALRMVVNGVANSFAVGDLDGDGKPDIYAAISFVNACKAEYERTGTFNDTWKDLVISTAGAPPRGYVVTTMENEPVANGCSWLASWGGPGIVHLGRGLEGAPGDSYSLKFE
ncbi:MAG TPA: VCBS repeat-containing protein [Ideonella sp.]|nr:VCBS repeat-containing protein [Ideonella sp.]